MTQRSQTTGCGAAIRRTGPLLLLLTMLSTGAQAVSFPGPDSFGYEGTLIPLNLRDVSTTGLDVGLDSVDDDTATTSIGFTFNYYGNNYSQVEISSNGFISFTPTGDDGCCSGDPIPDTTTPNNLIAGWWEDLDTSEGGTIRAETLGTPGNQEFIVGFYDVADHDDPDNVINTFEIILHEATGDIELAIRDVQFDDTDDKVTGIENADGTDGIEVIFVESGDLNYQNGDSVLSNQGYCFSTSGTACGSAASEARSIPTLSSLGILLLGASLFVTGLLGRRMRRRRG